MGPCRRKLVPENGQSAEASQIIVRLCDRRRSRPARRIETIGRQGKTLGKESLPSQPSGRLHNQLPRQPSGGSEHCAAPEAGPGRGRWSGVGSVAVPRAYPWSAYQNRAPATLPQAARSRSGSLFHKSLTVESPARSRRACMRLADTG